VGAANHPRLWRLLAEHALEHLDFGTAEKGFVHCRDMQGLSLVRHLVKLGVPEKQQAEVGGGLAGREGGACCAAIQARHARSERARVRVRAISASCRPADSCRLCRCQAAPVLSSCPC
jgi:hypothetical protein